MNDALLNKLTPSFLLCSLHFSCVSLFKIQIDFLGSNDLTKYFQHQPTPQATVNPPPSPLSSSSLSSPLGAEVCSRGHSVSAPSAVTGALGHNGDLPHTPWKVWVCVFLPAPPLRHSDWHVHLELLDEFFSYLFCNRLHIITAMRTHKQQRTRHQFWLDKQQQLTSYIMTFVLASRPTTLVCALFRPHLNVTFPPVVKMALEPPENFTFNSIHIWCYWQNILNPKKMKKITPLLD